MSEEERNVWMRFSLAGSTARAADSISIGLARASAAIRTPFASAAMVRTDSKSPAEAMGKPASMMSTPSLASWCAKRNFSALCMVQPGDCSPSRRVVSKKTIWLEDLEDIGPNSLDLDLIIMHAYDGR